MAKAYNSVVCVFVFCNVHQSLDITLFILSHLLWTDHSSRGFASDS